jgi:3-oxoacyl-(acyl-carrier-protein) synthase
VNGARRESPGAIGSAMTDLVAITGMGCISAAGKTVAANAAGLRNPNRTCVLSTAVGPANPYPVFSVADPEMAATPDEMRVARFAIKAAGEALASAGIDDPSRFTRVGVFMGSTTSCQLNDIEFQRAYRQSGKVGPYSPERYFSGHLAERVARRFALPAGPRWVVANACASATDSIGMAWDAIRQGLCDLALAGGADELSPVSLCGFHSLGVVSPAPCRPFDRDRSGLNLGEGAGVLVLEPASAAARRGRIPAVFVAGYGSAGDGHHMTAPHPDGLGLELAIRRALAAAGISPSDIAFVNAHGTATRDNDRIEGRTLAKIFGDSILAVSTKGYTGHALGGVGGMEAVFTAIGLSEGWIPASIGFENADPDIPLRPPVKPTPVSGRYAISTSLAFGGGNAALILRRDGEGKALQ